MVFDELSLSWLARLMAIEILKIRDNLMERMEFQWIWVAGKKCKFWKFEQWQFEKSSRVRHKCWQEATGMGIWD